MTVAVCILAYLIIGVVCVKVAGPLMWAKAEISNYGYGADESVRESVMAQSAFWLFLWPFMLIWTPLVAFLGKQADLTNPKRLRIEAEEQRRKIDEQQRRIAELERELQIGDYR